MFSGPGLSTFGAEAPFNGVSLRAVSHSMRGRILRALPALGWTMMIGWFSSAQWSAEATHSRLVPLLTALLPWLSPEAIGTIHWLVRKGGHAAEYGVLAALWALALQGWRWPLGLCVVTAFADELRQATTVARQGSVADALLDTAGAAVVLALVRASAGSFLSVLADGLLWLAAAGGTLLLGVNLAADARSGWLWLSVPAAWCAIIVRARATRRPLVQRRGGATAAPPRHPPNGHGCR